MKKTKFVLAAMLLGGTGIFAQNTFPASGPAGINTLSPNSDLQIIHNDGGCGLSYPTTPSLSLDNNWYYPGLTSLLPHNIFEASHSSYACTGLLTPPTFIATNSL